MTGHVLVDKRNYLIFLSCGYKYFVLFFSKRFFWAAFAFLINCASTQVFSADGELQTIREDVRGIYTTNDNTNLTNSTSTTTPAQQTTNDYEARYEKSKHLNNQSSINNLETYSFPYFLIAAGYTAIAPYSVPRMCLRDDSSQKAFFTRHPYQFENGYLLSEKDAAPPEENCNAPGYMYLLPTSFHKNWGCQIRADYIDNFDRLNGVSGQVILETTSRWGVQSSVHAFTEDLKNSHDDRLALGDCNLVYRFAQHQRGQMRLGIGANWLNDPIQTDLGFNFTYGGDFFPRKPWVISANIDWGTLGHAGLFRFRTSTGIIIRGFETYVGYEYSDIGSTQDNFLVSGIRIWF
jgi:hypothetical protein